MKIITGNLFTSQCQTRVNTVNCVGVMGAGIALEFKLRYPDMYTNYLKLCNDKQIDIGKLWLYKKSSQWVLNFPTKKHWRYPSRPDYLKKGLDKFMQTYRQRGIQSIAFPLLGAAKGGLSEQLALDIMASYLKDCTIPIEVYRFDPTAHDDLYTRFCQRLTDSSDDELIRIAGLRRQALTKIRTAITDPRINSLSQLVSVPGIGAVTLEKAFKLMQGPVKQQSLFDDQ